VLPYLVGLPACDDRLSCRSATAVTATATLQSQAQLIVQNRLCCVSLRWTLLLVWHARRLSWLRLPQHHRIKTSRFLPLVSTCAPEFILLTLLNAQDEPDVSIRKAAALAAARILSRSAQEDASRPLRQLVGASAMCPPYCRLPAACARSTARAPQRRPLDEQPQMPSPLVTCCHRVDLLAARLLAVIQGTLSRQAVGNCTDLRCGYAFQTLLVGMPP
jgi:hypothetical protein